MSQNALFRRWSRCLAAFAGLVAVIGASPLPSSASPKPGFVLHFNFISGIRDERHLLDVAQKAGAKAIVVVPPAHAWEDPASLAVLDDIFAEAERRGLAV